MPSTVTDYSPFELVHRMQMNTAFDHALATVTTQLPQEVNTFLANLKHRFIIMRDHAIVQSKAAKEAQTKQYDKRQKVKQVQMACFRPKSLVTPARSTTGKAKKMSSSFNWSFCD